MPPAPRAAPSDRARRASLQLVRTVAIIEAVLLLALVLGLVVFPGAVSIVGPLFGLAFAYLVYLAATGVTRGMWGWWFPGVVLVTVGLGTIPAERRLLGETE
jgi:hypothetical protein